MAGDRREGAAAVRRPARSALPSWWSELRLASVRAVCLRAALKGVRDHG
ncbi:hypothetical protein ACVDFE_29020 [Lentzea chajnantorensis]